MRELDAQRVAWRGVEIEAEALAGAQLNAAGAETADSQLGALDIRENADGAAELMLQGAYGNDAGEMILVRAVREVEAEDVSTRIEQAGQHFWGGTGWTNGRNDTSTAVSAHERSFGKIRPGALPLDPTGGSAPRPAIV
jgi:hypothetical protein